MAPTRSLLSRLEFPEPPQQRAISGNIGSLLDDIRRNLQTILNAKHGGSNTVPEFGLADFTDVTRGNASVRRVQEGIKQSIENYEPRLQQVTVSHTPRSQGDPFTLHFDISAEVAQGDQKKPIVFRSTIETSGEVTVKRF